MSSMVAKRVPLRPIFRVENSQIHSERDPESRWLDDDGRGIAAQQVMCGSLRYRTDTSHLQIVGRNLMNGSVRNAIFLFHLQDGHSSITLNQLSHFFNHFFGSAIPGIFWLPCVWYLRVWRYVFVPTLDDNVSIVISHKSVLQLLYDYVKYVVVRSLRNIVK
jgi:hypothetical protein